MGKHSKAHICVNKTGTDETSEYEGEEFEYSVLVRLWVFSVFTHIAEEHRIFKCRYCAIEKISREDTETALQRPSTSLTGSSTERMSANT